MGFLGIRGRRTGKRRSERRWGTGASRPDQHSVVLIHGELQHLDDFSGEILEVSVVELKLALEGTIRDTPPALEHGDRLVEDLLKGHRLPSLYRLRHAEDSVGMGKAVRAHIYRIRLTEERRKSWERVTQP
jgi:hypothetical protein